MKDAASTAGILVQDALGRVRTPREKRELILDEYERSGMSGAAFAGLVKSKISELGENIVICRFTRYMVDQGVPDEPAAE